ncbi:MAG: CatB-related O-acetyltransferase [Clostridia bacterium]|nr:CatB-related O-acetyltransferase [Clostridia bacterium]
MFARLKYYFAKAERILLRRPAVIGSKIHKKAKVCSGSQINRTRLDRYSYVGHDCFTVCAEIGAFCSIADGCRIGGAAHATERVSQSPVFEAGKNVLKTHFAQFEPLEPPVTVIGNDVWIGANAQIKSGVCVGNGAVIGMGSVVTHDVPPYEIWAGVPARPIGRRVDEETAVWLEKIAFWNWEEKKIRQYAPHMDSPAHLRAALEKENEI